ncbi:hypothetical protein [Enterococcus rivorum]|uniref:Uncharacterized protein n=1 Tax=Enterococcus rivorum TaxID=762845 RepID=A0A1E5KVM1_9ENTE|nr:hypothetical protein [Enterococcus rivorum]OEH81932.1 hypothetical protein BCR26_03730 [Enterococcus rivorum]
MIENPYTEKLRELKEGKIKEIIVEAKDFPAFREVWKDLPDRMDIVGEAGLNGRIVYRYVKTEE